MNMRRDGLRMSCALTYLPPARRRSNLEISPSSWSSCAPGRCRCAAGWPDCSRRRQPPARDLPRSAQGPRSRRVECRGWLRARDRQESRTVHVHHELAGVGRGLVDHPLNAIDLPAHAPVTRGPKYQAMLTARSCVADPTGPPDIHIFPAGPLTPTTTVRLVQYRPWFCRRMKRLSNMRCGRGSRPTIIRLAVAAWVPTRRAARSSMDAHACTASTRSGLRMPRSCQKFRRPIRICRL